MTNFNSDPPQGRSNSHQLRTTGRFSIPFISPPQGIGGGVPPSLTGFMLYEDDGGKMLYENDSGGMEYEG